MGGRHKTGFGGHRPRKKKKKGPEGKSGTARDKSTQVLNVGFGEPAQTRDWATGNAKGTKENFIALKAVDQGGKK